MGKPPAYDFHSLYAILNTGDLDRGSLHRVKPRLTTQRGGRNLKEQKWDCIRRELLRKGTRSDPHEKISKVVYGLSWGELL